MRLKEIAARIIIAGIAFGALARGLERWSVWLHKFWPLMMFIILAVGAWLGGAGMIASAFQRPKKISN
jgi:hypothetical protein